MNRLPTWVIALIVVLVALLLCTTCTMCSGGSYLYYRQHRTTNVVVNQPAAVQPAQQPATTTDRVKRLVELDKIYRTQGLEPWLKAAGFSWDGVLQEARQPEEETVIVDGYPKIVVTGVQLRGNVHANWPAGFTTDQKFDLDNNGRSHKIDATNPSVLVTNGKVNGTLTAYVDVSNWKQVTP